jgi:hypothetical protein
MINNIKETEYTKLTTYVLVLVVDGLPTEIDRFVSHEAAKQFCRAMQSASEFNIVKEETTSTVVEEIFVR